MFPKRRILDP